jgi:hypothetical protein
MNDTVILDSLREATRAIVHSGAQVEQHCLVASGGSKMAVFKDFSAGTVQCQEAI